MKNPQMHPKHNKKNPARKEHRICVVVYFMTNGKYHGGGSRYCGAAWRHMVVVWWSLETEPPSSSMKWLFNVVQIPINIRCSRQSHRGCANIRAIVCYYSPCPSVRGCQEGRMRWTYSDAQSVTGVVEQIMKNAVKTWSVCNGSEWQDNRHRRECGPVGEAESVCWTQEDRMAKAMELCNLYVIEWWGWEWSGCS